MTAKLNAAAILAEAEEKAGFTDGDAPVRANLEALVDALNSGPEIAVDGLETTAHSLASRMADRIKGLKWTCEHPEITDEVIKEPVFLTGLPRSGTTYFQYLFDNDRRFRLIRTWEAIMPNPPPGHDPQSVVARKQAEAEINAKIRPNIENFEALHLIDEDGPQECHVFLEQACAAAGFHNLYDVPAYFDFLMEELDLVAAYRLHKRQLQLLQWKCPQPRWALKYPNHVIAMDAIVQVYPDARFVMTHRDPVQTLASISKMSFTLRSARYADPVDPHRVGRQMLDFIKRHIDRLMAFCTGPEGHLVTHVDYYRLAADPVAMLDEIHAGLGIETPDDVRAAIAAWRHANPKNKRGANEYALEQFGIDEGEARELFADYIRHFDIPRETEGVANA